MGVAIASGDNRGQLNKLLEICINTMNNLCRSRLEMINWSLEQHRSYTDTISI